MYKRTELAIVNIPPNLQKSGQRCIGDFQFKKVNYYYDVAPCVRSRIDASCVTYVIIRKLNVKDSD